MKSHANLWPRVTSFENLYEAFRQARKGKRGRPDVAAFEFALESNLLGLQRELLGETYRPGSYRNFVVREPTERKISAAPFRDRVVHHALCRVIEPLLRRSTGASRTRCTCSRGDSRRDGVSGRTKARPSAGTGRPRRWATRRRRRGFAS